MIKGGGARSIRDYLPPPPHAPLNKGERDRCAPLPLLVEPLRLYDALWHAKRLWRLLGACEFEGRRTATVRLPVS
jgi:hypothetical protein